MRLLNVVFGVVFVLEKTNVMFYAWFKPHAFLNTKYGIYSYKGIACRQKKEISKNDSKWTIKIWSIYDISSNNEKQINYFSWCSTKTGSHAHIFMCSIRRIFDIVVLYLVSRVKCFHVWQTYALLKLNSEWDNFLSCNSFLCKNCLEPKY